MKTLKELRKELIATPAKFDFDEDLLDAVIDLFNTYGLDELALEPYKDRFIKNDYDTLILYLLDNLAIGINVELYNNYIDDNHYGEHLYDMYDFDDVLASEQPSDIASMILNGDFNLNDTYFYFDSRGNLQSADDVDVVIDNVLGSNYDIIEYAITHDDDLQELVDTTVLDVIHALFED